MRAEQPKLDFIVIGAQKAGTTSLFEYLRRHPEVSLPVGKEVPFFSHDIGYARGFEAYMESLAREQDGGVADTSLKWGTVTPQYMVGGVYAGANEGHYDERTVPGRIRDALPDVRLVAVLRDPVERAVSHHRMNVMRGAERRSFDEAIEGLIAPQALREARLSPEESSGYVVWGEYGRILAGYTDVFPREQLLTVFTEQLRSDPAALMRTVHGFIGVEAGYQPDNLGERYRVGAVERGFAWNSPSSWLSPSSPLSPQGLQRGLRRSRLTRRIWHALPRDRQERLRAPYRRAALRSARRNRSVEANAVSANREPSADTLARLREHYAAEAEVLTSILGVDPPWSGTAPT